MASSSSSYSRSWKNDVFLNFRGKDTRKTFVDHLYSALQQHGILTYKDYESLVRGDTIAPSLLKAIESSQILVIIFSENYADSSWCLDELSHIMKCRDSETGQLVIPIFYDVDPSDVRKQKGKYGEAFAKHELSEYNKNKVESWKKALVDASNIVGWVLEHAPNGDEAEFIQEIVGSILDKLSSLDSAVEDQNLVGLGTRLQITAFIRESKDLVIPFQVIKRATKNFTTILGKGGYGPVYKGELLLSGELTSLAIKRLDSKISGQGFKEFLTEIQLLSCYKHPNVVSLLGFCDEAREKILIYEYAENGSLDKHLCVAKTARPLTWKQRISICLDTARGLDYLHNHIATNHRVIHRDIKSANILIAHDWKAMIADLGLSKIGRANELDSYLITNPCGTNGYLDPAYRDTGILTKESDVYSFGVVMFEVLCGRLAFMNVNNEHRFLDSLAQRLYKTGRLNEIIDPYLEIEVNSDSLKRFSRIAYQCLLNKQNRRPPIGLVVQRLEEIMATSKGLAD